MRLYFLWEQMLLRASIGVLSILISVAFSCVTEIPREEDSPPSRAVTPITESGNSTFKSGMVDSQVMERGSQKDIEKKESENDSELSKNISQNGKDIYLEVKGPENDATVQSDGVIVHGMVSLDASLKIANKSVDLDAAGRFSILVDLKPGFNEIEINASRGDNSRRSTLRVTSAVLPPQPFFLMVTQPEDQSVVSQSPIMLAGRTSAGSVLSVNGVSVPVDSLGIYSIQITLDAGPNIIDVLATSGDGDVLSAVIAVIYRP